jgi:hypothetical protein
MIKLAFALLTVALVCGCICCGGSNTDLSSLSNLAGKSGDTGGQSQQACESPYIQVGTECCLDENGNGICDSEDVAEATTLAPVRSDETETTVTTTTQPPSEPTQSTQTTAAPTTTGPPTTLQSGGCTKDALLACKTGQDCGGDCSGYYVYTLGGSWRDVAGSGYMMRFDGKEGVDQSLKYKIMIRTPSPEGLEDTRPISTGESFIDHLRFKVLNYGEDTPKVYVKVNTEDAAIIPPQATLVTVGGLSCAQGGKQLCERNFNGFKVRMVNRLENGVSLYVTAPDGIMTKVQVNGKARTSYQNLLIGGFFDPGHFIQGGYTLLYLWTI